MVDRIDLLIAVAAIVVTVVGSSTAQWVALAKKADKDDLRRLEARIDDGFDRLESRSELKFDRLENKFDRLENKFERLENKFEALILRIVPEQLPRPES